MKKIFIILIGIIICGGIVIAADLISRDDNLCQDGMCLIEKIDLEVKVDNGDILINRRNRISDSSSTYQIEEVTTRDEVEVKRYIQTLDKTALTREASTTYSEQPNEVYESYHFLFYKDYERYCNKFRNCLPFKEYTYQTLVYDGYKINTKRVDEDTGEIYPTSWVNGGIKTKIPNMRTSVSFNDIVYSAGTIVINGSNIEWINFTRFLHDVAPECYYGNNSGIEEENISAVVLMCGLTLNHSASINWGNASMIFDLDITGDDPFLVGNKSIMNFTNFDFGTSGHGQTNQNIMRALDESIGTCSVEDGGSTSYSPNCGEMNWKNVNINSFGTGLLSSYQIMNGSFENVKFTKAQPAYTGKITNVKFETMHVLEATILGGRFEGNDIKIDGSSFGSCFLPVFSVVTIDLTGGTFLCGDAFAGVVLSGMDANITDADYISSTKIVNNFNGQWDFTLKKTINMKFRGDNCSDEVNTTVNISDSQGNLYNDKTTNFEQVVNVFNSKTGVTAVEIDFNPFTMNLTNSSYFPVTNFQCNFTETDQNGIWKMYEIPYAIELNPDSDFILPFV